MLSDRCLSLCLSDCPVCNVGVLWPNGWTGEDETSHAVGLGPGHIVLDGTQSRPFPPKGAQPLSPIFGPFLLWSNGSMHQDATWYGRWPQPRGLCVRWRPSLPQQRGHSPPPNFRPISIVSKQLDASRCHFVWL